MLVPAAAGVTAVAARAARLPAPPAASASVWLAGHNPLAPLP